MKQKINVRMIGISILAVLTTMFCITYVFYSLFKEQIVNDLRLEARLIAETGVDGLVGNQWAVDEQEIRITWISDSGEVLYDNDIAVNSLGNHIDRPEVREAMEKGYGESIRKSDTMKLRTYYYALALDDGTILRVSKEAGSFLSFYVSVFPIVALIIILIIVICITISSYLSRQLLKPIQIMAENIDYIPDEYSYKELSPFIERIRVQHDDILSSAKARQEFTANVSHELKTPITAISGYAELIENRMVDEEQQVKFAGDIRKNADRLVDLVNEIIRLSELDQHNISPEFANVNLYEIAKERVELLQNNGRDRQIQVELHGGSCETMANRRMMVELLDNLIQNAIRYNVVNGRVDVTVEKSDNHAVLTVADTGIGIPASEQDRIFERFYRVDKSRSRETGGTGLGLSIVKHIVELHEGNIRVQSKIGKGTTITVIL